MTDIQKMVWDGPGTSILTIKKPDDLVVKEGDVLEMNGLGFESKR